MKRDKIKAVLVLKGRKVRVSRRGQETVTLLYILISEDQPTNLDVQFKMFPKICLKKKTLLVLFGFLHVAHSHLTWSPICRQGWER